MSNIAFQRPHSEHAHEEVAPESPDPYQLQRLLGDLVNAASSVFRQRSDHEIRIRNFRSERMRLIDDLIIVMEDRGDQYIANSYDTGQYGIGHSPDDAIQHLCSVVEDYYELLLEDEASLGPNLKAHLTYLRSILRARE